MLCVVVASGAPSPIPLFVFNGFVSTRQGQVAQSLGRADFRREIAPQGEVFHLAEKKRRVAWLFGFVIGLLFLVQGRQELQALLGAAFRKRLARFLLVLRLQLGQTVGENLLVGRFVAIADDHGDELAHFCGFCAGRARFREDGIGNFVQQLDLAFAKKPNAPAVGRVLQGVPIDVFGQQAVGAQQGAADDEAEPLQCFSSIHALVVIG